MEQRSSHLFLDWITDEDQAIVKKALSIAAKKIEEMFLSSPLYADKEGDSVYWENMALGWWNRVQDEIDAIRLEMGLPIRPESRRG